MTSNDDDNQPEPSAALAAVEKHLKYIDCEIQKLENAVRDDKTIKYMSQLEHDLKSLWQRIMQFMENELATNKNKSIKDEQEVAVLQQRYAKFKDSYISYLLHILTFGGYSNNVLSQIVMTCLKNFVNY